MGCISHLKPDLEPNTCQCCGAEIPEDWDLCEVCRGRQENECVGFRLPLS